MATVEYLVVAGGGAGGAGSDYPTGPPGAAGSGGQGASGGGGGAGGHLEGSYIITSASAYTVTVGAGGESHHSYKSPSGHTSGWAGGYASGGGNGGTPAGGGEGYSEVIAPGCGGSGGGVIDAGPLGKLPGHQTRIEGQGPPQVERFQLVGLGFG